MIESGSGFASKLEASIKDFALGAVEYDTQSRFFSAGMDKVPASKVRRSLINAEHVYRLWMRPYDGGGIVTRGFVREFMSEIKRRYGSNLRWYAAIHLKPTIAFAEHRHFHVMMHGVELDRSIKQASARIGSKLLTKRLGFMSDAEVERMAAVSAMSEQPKRIQRFMRNWTLLPEVTNTQRP